MRLPVLALAAAPALLAAPGQALPEALTAQLKATPFLRVDFQQTRTLAALSRPLKSSGSLVVSREQGVIWAMAKPMALTVVVSPKGVLEVDAEGRKKLQTSKDTPMVAQMARIMKSLLEGQWSALDDLFSVTGATRPEGKWTILLAPKPRTAAFLKAVRIQGGRFIETIHVTEASGDATDLVFVNPRVDVPLTPAELRLFSFE